MPTKQDLSDLYGLPHELASSGGFKAHRTKERAGQIHNLLLLSIKTTNTAVLTMCGMEVDYTWIPYRGIEPTSCHRCQALAAYEIGR